MNKKIVLPGGAGLVGQNLVARLIAEGCQDIVVIDKHKNNLAILHDLHPDVSCICADLAVPGEWQMLVSKADVVVMLQAQIGGNEYPDFVRNNVESSRLVLDAMTGNSSAYLVHISSSVIESVAKDYYTNTKKEQEQMVLDSGIKSIVLRPTLMFGWFDRKHLGWLSRFMKKVPVFPIPGHGRYMRQPLYVGDFCNIIFSCIKDAAVTGVYNISGHEKIDYIDIVREIKQATNSKTLIIEIPFTLFGFLLWLWALFDRDPPFTTQQLHSLVAGDEFEVIDWPAIFNIPQTRFSQAIYETFNDSRYSKVILDF